MDERVYLKEQVRKLSSQLFELTEALSGEVTYQTAHRAYVAGKKVEETNKALQKFLEK